MRAAAAVLAALALLACALCAVAPPPITARFADADERRLVHNAREVRAVAALERNRTAVLNVLWPELRTTLDHLRNLALLSAVRIADRQGLEVVREGGGDVDETLRATDYVDVAQPYVYEAEAMHLFRMGLSPTVHTHCMAGWSLGHAAAALLSANPWSMLFAWDAFDTAPKVQTMDYTRALFPMRVFWARAPSAAGLRSAAVDYGVQCDVIVYEEHGVTVDDIVADVLGFAPATHCGTQLFVPRMSQRPELIAALTRAQEQGIIVTTGCYGTDVAQKLLQQALMHKEWCTFRYQPPHCSMTTFTGRVLQSYAPEVRERQLARFTAWAELAAMQGV